MIPNLQEKTLKEQIFNTVEEALEAIRNGEMVIVADDEDRENEGDLMMAASHVNPEAINFMPLASAKILAYKLKLGPSSMPSLAISVQITY